MKIDNILPTRNKFIDMLKGIKIQRDSHGRFLKGYKSLITQENSPAKINPLYGKKESLFYIMGVLFGDGYITKYNRNYHIGLVTKSLIFAKCFANSLEELGLKTWIGKLKFEKGRYYRVNSFSKSLYLFRKSFFLKDIDKKYSIFFIKGFYESEGHDRGRGRGLLMYNIKKEILEIIRNFLSELDIESHYTTNGITPDKKKIVYRLYIPSKFKQKFIDIVKPCIKIDSDTISFQNIKSKE